MCVLLSLATDSVGTHENLAFNILIINVIVQRGYGEKKNIGKNNVMSKRTGGVL